MKGVVSRGLALKGVVSRGLALKGVVSRGLTVKVKWRLMKGKCIEWATGSHAAHLLQPPGSAFVVQRAC